MRTDASASFVMDLASVDADGETLSGIALKYYGSAVKDKWMKIYELNKTLIGDNPGLIKPGQVLRIPEIED